MKAMVGLILVILIIFGLRLFWPMTDPDVSDISQSEVLDGNSGEEVDVIVNESDLSSVELNVPSDENKTKLMKAEYEVLEQSRKTLKRHIAHLKHDMWGLKFSPETAKKMSKTVMGASNLLNNPHMLGAFSSVEAIKDETAKINFAQKSLEEINEIIKAKVEENTGGTDQANSTME